MTLREKYDHIMDARRNARNCEDCHVAYGFDICDIVNALSADYDETVAFLKKATEEEISVAIDALEDLNSRFKKQELIDIFKQKAVEYPNIQKLCDCDYMEEIDRAECCLEEHPQ